MIHPFPHRLQAVLRALAPLCLLPLLMACAAPRPSAAPRGDLRIVVISDLNSSYGSTEYEPEVHRAIQLIREVWRPDLVLAAGDLIAGQKPTLSDESVRAMWSAFDAAVAGPLREADIPFGFTLGNHDGSAYPAHQRDRALAVAHWRNAAHHPGVAFVDSTHFPLYYSFVQGDVFVLVWDASTALTAENLPMMEWVREQLGSERAQAVAYRLVLGHLPCTQWRRGGTGWARCCRSRTRCVPFWSATGSIATSAAIIMPFIPADEAIWSYSLRAHWDRVRDRYLGAHYLPRRR
jgi:hypothetical protein